MSLKSRVTAFADRFAELAHEAGVAVWRSPSQIHHPGIVRYNTEAQCYVADGADFAGDPYAKIAQVYDCGSAESMPFELAGPFLALSGVVAVALGAFAGVAAVSEYLLQPIWTAFFQ